MSTRSSAPRAVKIINKTVTASPRRAKRGGSSVAPIAATDTTTTVNEPTTKSATKRRGRPHTTTARSTRRAVVEHAIHAAKTQTPFPLLKRNPLGHLLIEQYLRDAGFRGGISTKKDLLDAYSTDESIFSIRPQVVLQPKNRHDVEIAVTIVARETKRFSSLSLTPRAAGTGLGGGSLTDSIVIDFCTHLNKIDEVTFKKGVHYFSCEPGAMWRDVEKRLKQHRAYLPPYPASKDICSIGGAIGNNAAGPDSLRYGHCADWIEALDVVLFDGHTYTIKPLTYREFKLLVKQNHEHARIARDIFVLIEKNESEIKKGKPKTSKNTAGYALWSVMPQGVAAFKKGTGTFDLTRLIAGSQGTIGIITHITMRALPIPEHTTLLVVPIFDLKDAAAAITTALTYDPINVELFDALTFDLALKNPSFFKQRLDGLKYYQVMLSMYTTYHVRWQRKIPEFVILITLDEATVDKTPAQRIADAISQSGARARVISNPIEGEMFWQVRRASYSLSKFQDERKRPAAFLEDMTVPPEHLSKFFMEIKRLLKEFNVTAAVHGHGGNGHFHFYPLLDFTNKTTPALVEKMAEKFFSTAIKFKGNICGEHNDGIIRTPHLDKMFSKKMLDIFKETEHLFDPDDIFNPGKKVNPRFDIKQTMRKTN